MELAAAGVGQLGQEVMIGRTPHQLRVVLIDQEPRPGWLAAADFLAIFILVPAAGHELVLARMLGFPEMATLVFSFPSRADSTSDLLGIFDRDLEARRPVGGNRLAVLADHGHAEIELAAG